MQKQLKGRKHRELTYYLLRGIRCAKCHYYKFKTVIKGKSWKCRVCGEVINK